MKKFLYTVALLIVVYSISPSCTKKQEVKPVAKLEYSTVAPRKDIGTAD